MPEIRFGVENTLPGALYPYLLSDNDDGENRVSRERSHRRCGSRDCPSHSTASVVAFVVDDRRRGTTQRTVVVLVGSEGLGNGCHEVGEGGGPNGQDAAGPGGAHGRVR